MVLWTGVWFLVLLSSHGCLASRKSFLQDFSLNRFGLKENMFEAVSSSSPSIQENQNASIRREEESASHVALILLKAFNWNLLKNFLTPLEGEIDETCRADSKLYLDILNNVTGALPGNGWAYKMLDASGKLPPSGVLQGNLKWLGNFDSCLEVVAPTFKGKHCTFGFMDPNTFDDVGRANEVHKREFRKYVPVLPVTMDDSDDQVTGGIEALLQLVMFGRCIPNSCSDEDLKRSLAEFLNQTNTDLTGYVYNCHTADEKVNLNGGDWAMICIVLTFLLLLIIGTVIDVAMNYFDITEFNERMVQIFQGFSMYKNTANLFSTGNIRADSLTCINGIRFLSMSWVLFGHAYSEFQTGIPVTNLLTMFDSTGPIYGRVAFQVMLNAFPSVDTFFFIGATLLSYITLKELDKAKGGNIQFWIMYYVHRYIRLTGVYAIVIGLWATLLKFFATGPQSYRLIADSESCRNAWYVNLLYMNNLWAQWNLGAGWCLGQTWYLANDMQFFLISPIFIYSMWRSQVFGLTVSFLGLVAGTVTPLVLSIMNDYTFSPSFMTEDWSYFLDFYIVPWCRFQPYICGLIFGYFLHRMRDQPKLNFKNPYLSIWIWAIMGVIGAEVIYGLYPYVDGYIESNRGLVGSTAARAAYNGLHRLAWSVCIGWLILACAKGVGGPVNTILSWPVWIPLGRLSYCIYLVHLTVIAYFASIFTYSVTFSHTLGLYWILAMLCISIFVAYIMVILFEMPLAHMEKIFFAYIGIGKFPDVKKSSQGPN